MAVAPLTTLRTVTSADLGRWFDELSQGRNVPRDPFMDAIVSIENLAGFNGATHPESPVFIVARNAFMIGYLLSPSEIKARGLKALLEEEVYRLAYDVSDRQLDETDWATATLSNIGIVFGIAFRSAES